MQRSMYVVWIWTSSPKYKTEKYTTYHKVTKKCISDGAKEEKNLQQNQCNAKTVTNTETETEN